MQSTSRYIIAAGISSFALSILYFLSLVVQLSLLVTVPVILIAVIAVCWWMLSGNSHTNDNVGQPVWAWLILLAGVYMIVAGFYPVAEKFGGWDAWGIWNLHARYMADPANWKKMFQNTQFAHADYPLYIPSLNGFFMRLCYPKYVMVIPFIFNFAITLFIPVLIYIENIKKNIVVAAVIFFLFALDTFYLTKGATQYADTPLAFFLLCAFVCVNYATEDSKYVTLAAACVGCCMWTKNEGSILAFLFIVFYARTFFSRKNIKAFALGIVVPILVLLFFKLSYAPGDGTLSGQGAKMFSQLFVKDRYDMIWDFFKDNVAHKYYYVKILVFIYLLLCVLERRWPGKQFLLLLACTIAYTMIYVLTPGGIEWLLGTSQERLMHQLMPTLMYVMSQRFVDIHFSLSGSKQEAL